MKTYTNPENALMQPVGLITVQDYHAMVDSGAVDESVELLEGMLVPKMGQNSRHSTTIQLGTHLLIRAAPRGWSVRAQAPITTLDSEPEPDTAIVAGTLLDYASRHPSPNEVGLVIEVSDSTLSRDCGVKSRIYAHAGIPVYWIANLIDDVVEERRDPVDGEYTSQEAFRTNEAIPLILRDSAITRIAVRDLLAPRLPRTA